MLIFYVRNKLTRRLLMSIIRSIIKSNKIDCRYISIKIEYVTNMNMTIVLGNEFMIDRLNKNSIRICYFYYNLCYNDNLLDRNVKVEKVNKVILKYKEIDRNNFKNYIKNFYRS